MSMKQSAAMVLGDSYQRALQQGIDNLGLDLPEQHVTKMYQHLQMLLKWNKAYNLTAITDPLAMIQLHTLDSLSILPHIPDVATIADIGTGGGFPGIPLAIAKPDTQWTLVDASVKKIRFLKQVVVELGLKNVEPTHVRVENMPAEIKFDRVVSRAFSSLHDFISGSEMILADDGCWLAMKGKYPDIELAALSANFEYTVHALSLPEQSVERHLAILKRLS